MRIIESLEIGLSNPSHSHTWLLPQARWTAQLMPCRCIQTSAGVREIVLRSQSFLLSFVTEWNSGDRNQVIVWSATSNADVVFHSVRLQTSAVFTEIINQAEWGTLYYAMQTVSDSHRSAFSLTVYFAGEQSHLQGRSGSDLSRLFCEQWNIRWPSRFKFPFY